MKTLYVADPDGTPCNAKSRVSNKSLEILNRLLDSVCCSRLQPGAHFSLHEKNAGLEFRLP